MNLITSLVDADVARRWSDRVVGDLARLVRAIREEYPRMPGVAFYGYADGDPATPDLIGAAERLALECYPSRAEPAEEAVREPGQIRGRR